MFHFENLTPEVRQIMLTELADDIAAGWTPNSDRLTPRGLADYPALLAEAIREHDERWLTIRMKANRWIKTSETPRGKAGAKPRKVGPNAADIIAEDHFNRLYIRGVCLAAVASDPDGVVEVYRAKAVSEARPESEIKLGTTIRAADLLAALRSGQDTFGVPAGYGSGISVKIPPKTT